MGQPNNPMIEASGPAGLRSVWYWVITYGEWKMASKQSTVDYIREQIDDAGQITHRKMFGEYGLYCDGKFIGTICGDTLFLKVTDEAQAQEPELELAPAYDGAKPSFRIPIAMLEDSERLVSFVRTVHDSLPAKKK